MKTKEIFAGGLAGVVFAIGLVLGGMTRPEKVMNFLDLFGNWDPSLAFVMGGAIAVYLPVYWLSKRQRPFLGDAFHPPGSKHIDARLIIGGVLFGLGWGLAGYCPGPALVALGSFSADALIFGVALFVGMIIFDRVMGPQ